MKALVGVLCTFLLTGCFNMTVQLAPPDPSVTGDLVEGSDCIPIIFGIGIGTATVEHAKHRERVDRSAGSPERFPLPPITRIHTLAMTDYGFLGFGARCLEITGLPETPIKK